MGEVKDGWGVKGKKAISHQPSAVGCQLSVVGCQMLVKACQS